MCVSCLFSIMSLKGRRFSLDSSFHLDGHLGGRKGIKFSGNKSRHSLESAQMEIPYLHQPPYTNVVLRKQTIAEENLERSDGLINHNNFLKYNKTFHKLFQDIPEAENLTNSFTCALQKELLYHGKLFVSENHVCFHSSVLLKDTKVVIPASSVKEVKKHNSALSMLSIQTADGEKHSFVYLRHREMCYELLQSVCLHAQGESANSSPHLSSADNEVDHDTGSSYSSWEDSIDCQAYVQLTSEDPTRCSSTHQSSSIDEDDQAVSWIWRIIERVTAFFLLSGIRNFSILFHLYMILTVLLLLVSGYIGLRILALQEQLESLGAMSEWSLHHSKYQKT